jgi:hypothetical protein
MTRKSTPKHEIYSILAGTVVASGLSKTAALQMARGMGKNVIVRPTKRANPST